MKEIKAIGVNKDGAAKSFFYPLYVLSETRYAWGNLVETGPRSARSLEDVLGILRRTFRTGSQFTISFSFGFALVLKSSRPDINNAIIFENADGSLVGSTRQATQRNILLSACDELSKSNLTNNDIIEIANRTIGRVGHFEDDRLVFETTTHPICLFRPRNFENKELMFISNKFKNENYFSQIAKSDYYDSAAYQLERMGKTQSERPELTLNFNDRAPPPDAYVDVSGDHNI